MKHRVIPSDSDIMSVESRNLGRLRRPIKMGIFILFLVVIDQLTKLAAEAFFQPQINTGSALGLYIGKFPLFSLIIASLALIILVSDIVRKKRIGTGEILILSGGLSNIIDRGVKSGIVDWINFYGLWFNLADIYITLGVIGIILTITLRGRTYRGRVELCHYENSDSVPRRSTDGY